MMKRLSTFCLAILLMSACAPKLSYTWVKEGHEAKKYKKIAVFSFTRNLSVSADFQDDMVKFLRDEGYTAVAGLSLINPEQMKNLQDSDIKRILISEGIDAVISAIVVDKETSVNYVQGSNMGYGYGYPYGGFGGYYGYRYGPAYYNTGYYEESKTYLVENHFYEVVEGEKKEDTLIWASQSNLTDPSKKTRSVYAKVLIKSLKDTGIL